MKLTYQQKRILKFAKKLNKVRAGAGGRFLREMIKLGPNYFTGHPVDLQSAFVWSKTPEGQDYWASIALKIGPMWCKTYGF